MTPPIEAWTELAAILHMRDGVAPLGFEDPDGLPPDTHAFTARDRTRTVPGIKQHAVAPQTADELLLCRRMRAMHLDPDELYCREPSAFSELRKACASCEVPGRCARDLADEFADPAWQDWRNYCPNATTLSILRALSECGPDTDEVDALAFVR